jgi:hypothetical protein
MSIPDLDENGFLPPGIHDCTFTELEAIFGKNLWIPGDDPETRHETLCPNRGRLCDRLGDYLGRARQVGIIVQVLVDGSFVTSKADPNDIDLIVVLPADHDMSGELSPQEYNLLSKRRLRSENYPFDVFVAPDGSLIYHEVLGLFCKVKGRTDLKKGLLRVRP